MKRNYPDRPITAVGVVVIKGSEVLLIRRNKPPKSYLWSIPGGAQDLGEPLLKTAAREVLEETGITIKNITLLDAVDFIECDEKDQIRFHYSLIDYGAEYETGTLIAADDALEAKWVSFDELDHYNLWQETTEVIEKARVRLGPE